MFNRSQKNKSNARPSTQRNSSPLFTVSNPDSPARPQQIADLPAVVRGRRLSGNANFFKVKFADRRTVNSGVYCPAVIIRTGDRCDAPLLFGGKLRRERIALDNNSFALEVFNVWVCDVVCCCCCWFLFFTSRCTGLRLCFGNPVF